MTLFSPLLSIITLEEMTIKHLIYMQKVPLHHTERACVVFPVLKFTLEEKLCQKECCKYFGPEGVEAQKAK